MVGLVTLGVSGLFGTQAALAQFPSEKVSLYSQINLGTFGAGSGNDCWGYVSPSGREYALMSVSNKVAFVEITDPVNPDWFASIAHPNSLWGDVKVYLHVAYAVTEQSGTGIQVIDLSNIDNHVVTLVRTIPQPTRNHNVAVDTTSGYLYTCGSNGGSATTVIFDLSDPTDPVQVGTWSGAYEHDAQIITYLTGPYAGRQIMFGASEGRGLDVIDVTNKSNTFLMSRTSYPNVAYCHQLWTEDLQYIYINDELDGINRTTVFDIADLDNPVLVGEYSSGLSATDHNNYVRDGFVYEADYHSGLRIFNLNCDPLSPPQVGWFDTYPENDGNGYDGAWSCYPFFPSGTVIVSDLDRGLFVLDVSEALATEELLFDYPDGQTRVIDPTGGTRLRVEVSGACDSVPEPGTGLLHYDAGNGFVTVPLEVVSPNVYDAVFPAIDCGVEILYYISAESSNQTLFTDPPDAPATTYSAIGGISLEVALEDNFETDAGWQVANLGASGGGWQRGVPVNDPNWAYDPISDSDGSGRCYLTENQLGNTDVDNGTVDLISPFFDLSGGETIAYDYYLFLSDATGGVDRILVDITGGTGESARTEIARHDTSGGLSWRHHEITEADLVAAGVVPNSGMKLRFSVNDADPQSIVEAGLDAFLISKLVCCAGADGDMNGDSVTDGRDIRLFVDALVGTPSQLSICHGDFNDDGDLHTDDIPGLVTALLTP
jgi:choice-of-anchor B domain-containing protein